MSQNAGPTIYDTACKCSELFESIVGLMQSRGSDAILATELLGRFRLWASYLGVFAMPKASLDARLEDHKKIRDMVLELLEMLERNLQWGFPKSDGDPQANPEDDSQEDFQDDSLEEMPGLNAAEAAIDRLLILAVAIRRSARRTHKLRDGTDGEQAGMLCCLLMQSRYPNARKSLCNQLGRSIHTRGTSLLYLKIHNQKLAFERQEESSTNDRENNNVTLDKEKQERQSDVDRPVIRTHVRGAGPDTLPSELSPSLVSRFVKAKNKPSGSLRSGGWTVQDDQPEQLYYPSMPEILHGKKYRICDLCGDPLEEHGLTTETWKAHVDQDLEPYVCISEECREPPRYFVRRRDWLDHMQKRHSMTWAEKIHTEQWYCDIGHDDPLEFDERGSFVNHLKCEHGDQLTKSKLEGRARRNRRIATRDRFICPLCDCIPEGLHPCTQEDLWYHIAAHLKSLAFLSLSYVDDGLGDQDSLPDATGGGDSDVVNLSRPSPGNRSLDSSDDVPSTQNLEVRIQTADLHGIPDAPPVLREPQSWAFIP
ncbi:hypothetical protein B0J13DRAFT_450677, partial [Dactylonectria estremocensis]